MVPPSARRHTLLLDSELQILQIRGQTGGYLEPAPGDPPLAAQDDARGPALRLAERAEHGAPQSREAGFDRHLVKPVAIERVVAAIQSLVAD